MIYTPLRIYDQRGLIDFLPDRTKYILELCGAQSVLHVGCTDAPITQSRLAEGTLLHANLCAVNSRVIGIDICEEGLQVLRDAGFGNVKKVDAERMTFGDFGQRFDIVLAGDVVEHLNNPGLFIESAKQLLGPAGVLIIGVPSALTVNNYKAWLLNREAVHKDHCFYFSPKTLSCLCERYGLLPTSLAFTVQPLTSGETSLFGSLRTFLLRQFKSMSPSFVMSFRKRDAVDKNTYLIWK